MPSQKLRPVQKSAPGLRGINIEHKQIQKNILTDDENYHGTQYIKRFFWYLLVLISNS